MAYNPNQRCASDAARTLPDGLAADLMDQVYALKDVLQAFDTLEALVDPLGHAASRQPTPEISPSGMGALLRALNGTFGLHLGAVESLLEGAAGRSTSASH